MSKENKSDQSKKNKPLVVGIGASAGGLEPLKTFFEALPKKTGMAFIVIVHLSPEHESSMAELLQAHTSLSVRQVDQKTKIKEDCVYIIPPKKVLSVGDNHLELSEPEGARRPPEVIDHLFRSLGTAKCDKAVAIILSGTGSDGTVGIKRVKEHGGFIIVQDPDEAQYGGMPQSAIDTGLADKVLPVNQMAEALLNYEQSMIKVRISDNPDGLSDDEEEILSEIFDEVEEETDHDFSHYKRTTMLRRIERRMHVHTVESLAEYLSVLKEDSEEADELFKDMLISVTNFFRDPEAFEALKTGVLPNLLEHNSSDGELRVWVPGCATGEEAYSIAMLLAECAEEVRHPPRIQIFATDLDEQALQVARLGRYPESIAADLTESRLDRFFTKDSHEYKVKEKLRNRILFSRHDLLRNPPFSNQDLISCRNLLIYLNRKLQGEVFNLFHYALKQQGVLFLGSSDSNLKATELFKPLDQPHRMYEKKSGSQATSRLPSFPLQFDKDQFSNPSWKMPSETKTNFERLHQQVMTRRHAPPSVIINENQDVLHATGNISRYVNYRQGTPSRNILEMVVAELRQPLRSILYRAKKEKTEPFVRTQVQVNTGDDTELVELDVEQLKEKDFPDDLLLVVFKKVNGRKSADGKKMIEKEDLSEEETEIIEELENEVAQTKRQLQNTVEDYETSNEELRSSNEELQSMNEELQSTTEELETSEEELRSVNEELKTVNQELETKVGDLQQANNDLKNLMEATEIAIIFVDRDLRLQRFTSKATDIFNLTPSDKGRPLDHFTHRLRYDSVMSDIKGTLDNLDKIQKQVTDEDGNTYIMRLRPYHTTNGKIEGVVMTLVNVTKLKAAREELAGKIDQIKSLQRQIIKADIKDRWKVGQYLHDEVGQSMVAAKINLRHLKEELALDGGESTEQMEEVENIIDRSLDNVRSLSHEILPIDVEEEGMEYAFRGLAAKIERMYSLNCAVEVGDVVKNLDDIEIATNLYRIAHEAAKNAALHGNAKNIRITLQAEESYLYLNIEDDGRGFAAAEQDGRDSGMGIQIMRHRMELMGGTLDVNESDYFENIGARISCKMPRDGQL